MYDEWSSAYFSSKPATRARSKSILQTVALQGDNSQNETDYRHSPDVPKVNVIHRVKSTQVLSKTAKNTGVRDEYLLYPFSIKEREQFNDLSSWCQDEFAVDSLYDDVDYANDLRYTSFIDSCDIYMHTCDELLRQSDSELYLLDQLVAGLKYVKIETGKFKSSCDRLVQEQNQYGQLCDDIDSKLEIFASLESITKQLNAPGSSLVVKTSFKDLLKNLDRGIDYVQKEKNMVDITVYRLRFQQCMTRALTLIDEYVNNHFKKLASQVENQLISNKKQINGPISNTTQQALLYAKFNTDAKEIYALVSEIATRAVKDSQYDNLYTECLQSWFAMRYKLIYPVVSSRVEDYTKDNRSLPQLARSCLSFHKEIYIQELVLFNAHFPMGRQQFEVWVVELCEPLYDLLRHRIIRESSIDNLCELTSMLLSFDTDYTGVQDQNLGENTDNISQGHEDSSKFVKQILYDTQTRLVFRVQTYIETELVRYVPRPEDVNVLNNRRRRSSKSNSLSQPQTSKETVNAKDIDEKEDKEELSTSYRRHESLSSIDTSQLLEGWYPPLRKSINLLSQIYQLVKSKVFDDLAHTIVHECIRSLTKVHQLALSRLGPLEAQLFTIKHLLMLQTQIMEFDIDTVPTEVQVDFSGLQEVFNTLRQEGISFSSTNLLKMARVGAPRVIYDMVDAKQELYSHLKNCIHDFTEEAVKCIVSPILGDDKPNPDTALEDTRQLRQNASTELPRIRRMIENYIEDARAIDILIDSIQDLVIQTYQEYYNKLVVHIDNPEQIEDIMELDGLISWLSSIVGQLYRTSSTSNIDADSTTMSSSVTN